MTDPIPDEMYARVLFADLDSSNSGENALVMLCGPTMLPSRFSRKSAALRSSMRPTPVAIPALMMIVSRVDFRFLNSVTATWIQSGGRRSAPSRESFTVEKRTITDDSSSMSSLSTVRRLGYCLTSMVSASAFSGSRAVAKTVVVESRLSCSTRVSRSPSATYREKY